MNLVTQQVENGLKAGEAPSTVLAAPAPAPMTGTCQEAMAHTLGTLLQEGDLATQSVKFGQELYTQINNFSSESPLDLSALTIMFSGFAKIIDPNVAHSDPVPIGDLQKLFEGARDPSQYSDNFQLLNNLPVTPFTFTFTFALGSGIDAVLTDGHGVSVPLTPERTATLENVIAPLIQDLIVDG